MEIIVRPSFYRDIQLLKRKPIKLLVEEKIIQIQKAKDLSHITGLKKLKHYETLYRIKIVHEKITYRMGVIIRGYKIWLVRFMIRKKIYDRFP